MMIDCIQVESRYKGDSSKDMWYVEGTSSDAIDDTCKEICVFMCELIVCEEGDGCFY